MTDFTIREITDDTVKDFYARLRYRDTETSCFQKLLTPSLPDAE